MRYKGSFPRIFVATAEMAGWLTYIREDLVVTFLRSGELAHVAWLIYLDRKRRATKKAMLDILLGTDRNPENIEIIRKKLRSIARDREKLTGLTKAPATPSLTEYALVIAMVCIVTIAALTAFATRFVINQLIALSSK